MKIRSIGKVKAGFPAIVKKQQAEFKADKAFMKKYKSFEGGIAEAEKRNNWIDGIGKSEGLSGEELETFTAFMVSRFPKENNEDYIRTWAVRFAGGKPEAYCDSESLQTLNWVKSFRGGKK